MEVILLEQIELCKSSSAFLRLMVVALLTPHTPRESNGILICQLHRTSENYRKQRRNPWSITCEESSEKSHLRSRKVVLSSLKLKFAWTSSLFGWSGWLPCVNTKTFFVWSFFTSRARVVIDRQTSQCIITVATFSKKCTSATIVARIPSYELISRPKWFKNVTVPDVGALCLIRSEITPSSSQWSLAKIVKLHPEEDGVIRVAIIQPSTSEFVPHKDYNAS